MGAPAYHLVIHGQDAGGGDLGEIVTDSVTELTWEEDADMATVLTLRCASPDRYPLGSPSQSGFLTDSKLFAEGNVLDVHMGYGNVLELMGRVEITRWLPNFPQTGVPTLTIKGMDGRHRMLENKPVKHHGKKSKHKTIFANVTDEEVVRQVADKYGFKTISDSLAVAKNRVQKPDEGDLDFLRRLARIHNFILFCQWSYENEAWLLYFVKDRDDVAAQFQFEYRPTSSDRGMLLNVDLDFATTRQSTDVEVIAMDRRVREMEDVVALEREEGERVKLASAATRDARIQASIVRGARVRFTAFGSVHETFTDRPFATRREAEDFVNAYLRRREGDFIVARGTMVGLEALRPFQVHRFTGLGERFDGDYQLRNVRHVMKPGSVFKTEFVANRVVDPELTVRPRPRAKAVRTKSDGVVEMDAEVVEVPTPGARPRIDLRHPPAATIPGLGRAAPEERALVELSKPLDRPFALVHK